MVKMCYWCAKHMGEKDGSNGEKVFYSVCDGCYSRLGLEERLPDLIRDIVALRGNGGKVLQETSYSLPLGSNGLA